MCGFEEERKDRKGDIVCRKNEKSTGRGWNSISESTRGNEEASR